MSNDFEPMLAVLGDGNYKYPLLASTKLDGIRCIILNGVAVTRKLIAIPNDHIRTILSKPEYEGLDGELIVGYPNDSKVFNNTQRAVMKKEGIPDFTFWVFDRVNTKDTYNVRYTDLWLDENIKSEHIKILEQVEIYSREDLYAYEDKCLHYDTEGVILRSIDGLYKYGRSTLNEGYLIKIKSSIDSECEVLDVHEQMTNTNTKTKDNLGNSKRSSKKEGLVPANMLGCITVKDIVTGKVFGIGSGFTKKDRIDLWKVKDSLIGQFVKYRYFDKGNIDLPRHPRFIGFRDSRDM
jgi:DNA ligase-1